MQSYQYRKSHCGDKMILRPSYLHHGISYTSKRTSLYQIRTQKTNSTGWGFIWAMISGANLFKEIISLWHWKFGIAMIIHHHISHWNETLTMHMLCTAQLGCPVLKASGRVQYIPFQQGDRSPMITDQHTAGGSVSQLTSQALTLINPFHKRHYYIISTLQ